MDRNVKVTMDMRALGEKVKEHYALPPDSIYQGCEYDSNKDSVTMAFKHQTFDMVKEPAVVSPPASEPEKSVEDSGDEAAEFISKLKKKNG